MPRRGPEPGWGGAPRGPYDRDYEQWPRERYPRDYEPDRWGAPAGRRAHREGASQAPRRPPGRHTYPGDVPGAVGYDPLGRLDTYWDHSGGAYGPGGLFRSARGGGVSPGRYFRGYAIGSAGGYEPY